MLRIAVFFLLYVTGFAGQTSDFDARLAAGKTALHQGHYSEAENALRDALAQADKLLPSDPARLVDVLESLSDLDLLVGRYAEAIASEERATTTMETMHGQENPGLVPYLNRLAIAYREGGQPKDALPVLNRILALDIKALPPDDEHIPADFDNLAAANAQLRDFPSARAFYQRALQARLSRLHPDDLAVANTWFHIGNIEEHMKNVSAARRDYERALSITQQKAGSESYSLTGILDRLGLMLRSADLYSDAELVLQRSLTIKEKTLGSQHSEVATSLDDLALAYYFDKRYVDAEPLFDRSLEIRLATLNPYSPLIAQSMESLGANYLAQQHYNEAEPLFKKALAIRETLDIVSLDNLALVYQAKHDLTRAETCFQRAILLGDKGIGGEHPEIVHVMDEYAALLASAHRAIEAKKVATRAAELRHAAEPRP